MWNQPSHPPELPGGRWTGLRPAHRRLAAAGCCQQFALGTDPRQMTTSDHPVQHRAEHGHEARWREDTSWPQNIENMQMWLSVVMRPSSSSPIPKLKSTRMASSHQQYASGTSSHRTHQLLTPPRPSDPPLRPGWGMPSMLKPYCLFLVHFPVLLKTFCAPSVVECCPNYWDSRSIIKKKTAYFLFNEELKRRHKLACKHSECINISICRLHLVVLSTFIQLLFLFESELLKASSFFTNEESPKGWLVMSDTLPHITTSLMSRTQTAGHKNGSNHGNVITVFSELFLMNRTKDWVNNPCVYLSISFLLMVSLPLLCFGSALMQGPPRIGGLPERLLKWIKYNSCWCLHVIYVSSVFIIAFYYWQDHVCIRKVVGLWCYY